MDQNQVIEPNRDEEMTDLEFVEELINSDNIGRAEHDTAVPHCL